jgi:hypothetical protein
MVASFELEGNSLQPRTAAFDPTSGKPLFDLDP